jgi:hypothetical protein
VGPGSATPASIVTYIAGQLDLDPAHLQAYAIRDRTRREHLAEIQRVFGFRPFSLGRYRELSRWLLPTALATDVGAVLVGALIDELRLRQIIIPALSTLEGCGCVGYGSAPCRRRCAICTACSTTRSTCGRTARRWPCSTPMPGCIAP